MVVVEVDGQAATPELLAARVLAGDGHYTSMQVRRGAVRGLAVHTARLDAATREVFGAPLDGELVAARVAHALGTAGPDARHAASVRVDVFRAGADGPPSTMVTVSRPASAAASPQRLRPVAYVRPFAHLKHPGTFGQAHHARLARAAGFDDVLLVATGGLVAETSIANVGFLEGERIVWPDAPALAGVTMQLLEAGLACERRPVALDGLGRFDGGAVLVNSLGVAPVAGVDGTALAAADDRAVRRVRDAYESVPWDPVA